MLYVRNILAELWPWHLEFLHILACLLNSSYILAWIWMKLGRDVALQDKKCMWEDIHVRQIFTHFSLSSKLLLYISLHRFGWNLAGMLRNHKSRSAFWEIIHVRTILAELWPLTIRIFTHFSLKLSSQLLYLCMDLNETLQRCCTTSLEVHVGRWFMFKIFWQSYGPWHLEFLHILAHLLEKHKLGRRRWVYLCCRTSPESQPIHQYASWDVMRVGSWVHPFIWWERSFEP